MPLGMGSTGFAKRFQGRAGRQPRSIGSASSFAHSLIEAS